MKFIFKLFWGLILGIFQKNCSSNPRKLPEIATVQKLPSPSWANIEDFLQKKWKKLGSKTCVKQKHRQTLPSRAPKRCWALRWRGHQWKFIVPFFLSFCVSVHSIQGKRVCIKKTACFLHCEQNDSLFLGTKCQLCMGVGLLGRFFFLREDTTCFSKWLTSQTLIPPKWAPSPQMSGPAEGRRISFIFFVEGISGLFEHPPTQMKPG